MAEVKWLPEALDDLERLYQFLYVKNPDSASRAAAIVLGGAKLLKTSPRIGKPMPDETAVRELFMSFGAGAYVLRYKLVGESSLIIIRVWHSRENRS